MENEPRHARTIVPKDKNKQLSLPAEMIQRGLELAAEIEQMLGIKQTPQELARKKYMVRCYLAAMEWRQEVDRSPILREADENISTAPVYLFLSIDENGIHVSCASTRQHSNLAGIENNEDRYRLLTALDNLDPITIPIRSFGLYYVLSSPVQRNLRFKLGPSGGKPGFQGPLTIAANPYLKNTSDEVEIIVVYISLAGDSTLKQDLFPKKPPLKLDFCVIDPKGENDPAESRELYNAIFSVKNPSFAAEQR